MISTACSGVVDTPPVVIEALSTGRRGAVLAGLAVVTVGCWIISVGRMRGMDAGPGTDLGGLGWFLGIWVAMMAAMMLPSAAPTTLLVARLRSGSHVCVFVLGYLAAWTGYGVAAYGIYRALRIVEPSFLSWHAQGPWVAGGALILAGLYQATPLKTSCLRHCRSPLSFLLRARDGLLGTGRAGVGHGLFCVGCCAGLMLALFALGVMSLVWMGLAGLAILVEKTMPRGMQTANLLAVALIALGIWVAVSPGTVPGLTLPHHQMGLMGR